DLVGLLVDGDDGAVDAEVRHDGRARHDLLLEVCLLLLPAAAAAEHEEDEDRQNDDHDDGQDVLIQGERPSEMRGCDDNHLMVHGGCRLNKNYKSSEKSACCAAAVHFLGIPR